MTKSIGLIGSIATFACIGVTSPAIGEKASPERKQCPFVYSKAMQDKIVGPVLKDSAGKYFHLFDGQKPTVRTSKPGSNVYLLDFLPTDPKKYPPIMIVVDACKKQAWRRPGPFL